MKWYVGLSLVLGVCSASPSLASSEETLSEEVHLDTFVVAPRTLSFEDPRVYGFRFHKSVAPDTVCSQLKYGPSVGPVRYAKLTFLEKLHVFSNGELAIAAKFHSKYVKSIACREPDFELAREFMLQEIAKYEEGKRPDDRVLKNLLDLYPSLNALLPMDPDIKMTTHSVTFF